VNDVLQLARPEIRTLEPYRHAAWAPAMVRLHANENPWADETDGGVVDLNHYPEPQPRSLVVALSSLYGVAPDQLLIGRGSDEGIDLLVRAFCCAGRDRVIVCPPTFGMYGVAAAIQGAGVAAVPLDAEFGLDADAVLDAWSPGVKIVFLCSPNNPTGNSVDPRALERIASGLDGRALVVLDEAYVEFSRSPSLVNRLQQWPGLVILRTLSKAHGLAGARCGAVLAAAPIISLLARMIPPYALPAPTIAAALGALGAPRLARARDRIDRLIGERERMRGALARLPTVRRIWPSDANFLLVEFADAPVAHAAALRAGLLLRDLSRLPRLEGCLRVTIGTPEQNDRLIAGLEAA